ncbi:hypothetical protein Tsp_10699 [Trichinella spiralis]|uniref:hypothetical protein n=1 Tax=Trichinella spiralis TaxID=6334 RepID=UPI0001EFEE2C|nr:hypothetical protein Tsp_10699 [Trichinella spiralis]
MDTGYGIFVEHVENDQFTLTGHRVVVGQSCFVVRCNFDRPTDIQHRSPPEHPDAEIAAVVDAWRQPVEQRSHGRWSGLGVQANPQHELLVGTQWSVGVGVQEQLPSSRIELLCHHALPSGNPSRQRPGRLGRQAEQAHILTADVGDTHAPVEQLTVQKVETEFGRGADEPWPQATIRRVVHFQRPASGHRRTLTVAGCEQIVQQPVDGQPTDAIAAHGQSYSTAASSRLEQQTVDNAALDRRGPAAVQANIPQTDRNVQRIIQRQHHSHAATHAHAGFSAVVGRRAVVHVEEGGRLGLLRSRSQSAPSDFSTPSFQYFPCLVGPFGRRGAAPPLAQVHKIVARIDDRFRRTNHRQCQRVDPLPADHLQTTGNGQTAAAGPTVHSLTTANVQTHPHFPPLVSSHNTTGPVLNLCDPTNVYIWRLI